MLLALLAACLWFFGPWSERPYRSFPSPDGRYRIVVFRRSVFPGMMPGQASDAPGTVRLYDHQGEVLREARVEMVQLVDRVDWEPHEVTIGLVADWNLPGN